MKTRIILSKVTLALTFLFVCIIGLFAQDAGASIDSIITHGENVVNQFKNSDPSTVEGLDALTMLLFGVITVVAGYLSHWIPLLKGIKDTTYRVIGTIVALILAFTFFKEQGTLSALEVSQYLLSSGVAAALYDWILKRFIKTKNLAESKVAVATA